jgi:hypothetical protein
MKTCHGKVKRSRKRLSLHDKAMLAMREAVKDVILRHKKEKRPLAVWSRKQKKVIFMSPSAALRKYNKQ